MQIRPARIDEVDAIHALVQRAYDPYVARIGRRPGPMDDDYAKRVRQGAVSVADDAGVIGLIALVAKSDHLLIENVAVEPDRQGNGIGRALLAFAETQAREARIATLRLYANAAMTENLLLYARLGYEEVDRRTDGGFERVFFAKRL